MTEKKKAPARKRAPAKKKAPAKAPPVKAEAEPEAPRPVDTATVYRVVPGDAHASDRARLAAAIETAGFRAVKDWPDDAPPRSHARDALYVGTAANLRQRGDA